MMRHSSRTLKKYVTLINHYDIRKKSFVDKLEILPELKIVQVRTATIITDNGVEISRSFHRSVLNPNDDVSGQEPLVQKIFKVVQE